MRIGIDASNIRGGGGVTYLSEMLQASKPKLHGISSIIVWGGSDILRRIPPQPWLSLVHDPLLDKSLPFRLYWQFFHFSRLSRQAKCDLIYSPGSIYVGNYHPSVTISRNMLPFDMVEMNRYGLSVGLLRNLALRFFQSRTFERADGVIFLTNYAHQTIARQVRLPKNVKVIAHGIHQRFASIPERTSDGTRAGPVRLLYVSTIDRYKHQWHVVEAVSMLRAKGASVELELVGPCLDRHSLKRLTDSLDKHDEHRSFARYTGAVPHEQLQTCYRNADIFVFASSCENRPNILIEAMASGLPIACSNKPPMPEVLGDAGFYFDPDHPEQIAEAIEKLLQDPNIRLDHGNAARAKAKDFSWEKCAASTLEFLSQTKLQQFAAHEGVNHHSVL